MTYQPTILNMKSILKHCLFIVLSIFFNSACSEDPVPMLQAPIIENVELGSGDNGIAIIGQDFHFNADVVAGDKIETVEITIRQKGGETYPADWSMSIIWDQYKGLKNTNVHKHYDIPEDAVEGIYEVVILVKDQNGETTEVIRNLTIYNEVSFLN
jgi:hypothetical protein